MHKLVIIDDDHIILRGLTRRELWETNGFELAGSAHNGEDGLEIIEREHPQVVISDIRMPFMDGLELTEAIKVKFPDIKIILMTSYDDFVYAQKALKLKVFDFVLKPVENDKLTETARRAAAEWEQEQSLTKKVLEGIPFLRQRFYENLLRGRYKEEQIQDELAFLEVRLEAGRYAVILLIADDYYETGPKNRFGQELLKYCIANLAQEVLDSAEGHDGPRSPNGIVFEHMDDEIAILFSSDEEESVAERSALQLAERIRANTEQFLKTTVTVGVGSFTPGLAGMAKSYADAKAATEFRHLTGTNQVLTYRDAFIKPQVAGWSGTGDGWESELAMKTKLGLRSEALDVLRQTEDRLLSGYPLTLDKLQFLGIQMVFVIINAFQDWNEPPYAREAVDELLQELRQLRTAKELFDRIRLFLIETTTAVNERRGRQQKQLVDEAMDYIRGHYMKEGLSLQEVAEHVHISANHFSMMFKKEAGINFSDFLTDTRMKAAEELFRTQELKSYEVAERVGYGNPQYFSVLFKKHTGKTPSEFKHSK